MDILVIRLEGPLQSWGEAGKWNYKDTRPFPTKSGILGMLGAAIGLERGNPMLVELSKSIDIAVRRNFRGTELCDFQTVSPDQLISAEGKPKRDCKIIYKHYLVDVSFTAAITGDLELLRFLQKRINAPKWSMYLGRKNCVPSKDFNPQIYTQFPSMTEALRQVDLEPQWGDTFEIERTDMDGQYEVNDELYAEGKYRMRIVTREIVKSCG